ncbi:MAG TPA: GNAT family N-acetyltransferase [Gaiellaceae bacterium]|nr:GNAT family N-acetyltransferase [Gaiellaceae bacterium]
MAIEIRPPADDELRAAMDAAETAFGSEVEDHDWERARQLLAASRALAAYDGGRPVALAAAYAFDLSIPGGELPCAGVTWVGVMPTHRRRGILRDLMRRQLGDVRAWGEPIAALWASESSIYGRFGYGMAAPGLSAASSVQRFGLRDGAADGVTVRLVSMEEALERCPPVYARMRAGRAGMLSRSETWWKELRLADPQEWRRGASRKFYALAERDGAVEGYTTYRVKSEWEHGFAKGEVQVVEVVAATPAATLALWRYLHGIDLTLTVQSPAFDPASPLLLNAVDPRALGLRLGDALWLRLVDLDAALRARSYRPGEAVVLEVRDELCPWNEGRYRVGNGAGRTDEAADLALDTRDLASVYLGAFDFHHLAHAGLVEERRDGALEAASHLFRTDLPPYCPEVF